MDWNRNGWSMIELTPEQKFINIFSGCVGAGVGGERMTEHWSECSGTWHHSALTTA